MSGSYKFQNGQLTLSGDSLSKPKVEPSIHQDETDVDTNTMGGLNPSAEDSTQGQKGTRKEYTSNGGPGVASGSGSGRYGGLDYVKSKDSGEGGGYDGGSHLGGDEECDPLMPSDNKSAVSHGTYFLVYISHFLSAWGDRMWTFAVGLFLVIITPDSLQLTAVFGLTMGMSVLLLGPIIGDWVDNTPRLRAAQVSLVLQNALVVTCAAVIYCYLMFEDDLLEHGDWVEYVAYALIIIFSSAANLASIANTIAVERDWIVEICGRNEDKLATMTATMRAIDLTTQIVAPIATGQIMTFAGEENGAIFIGAWNLCSVIVEYVLIWKVYNTVPALRKKKGLKKVEIDQQENPKHVPELDENQRDSFTTSFQHSMTLSRHTSLKIAATTTKYEYCPYIITILFVDFFQTNTSQKLPDNTMFTFMLHLLDRSASLMKSGEVESNIDGKTSNVKKSFEASVSTKKGKTCSQSCRIFSGITIIIEGWRTYARYEVWLSGLSLAMLYMTVLGFDNVTVGYAKIQGLSESTIGIMMGGGGLFGIFGTMLYPTMHRWLGLPRTGLASLTLQSSCLVMCVVSVWLPGSPFDLFDDLPLDPVNCTNLTATIPAVDVNASTILPPILNTSIPENIACPDVENSLVSVIVLMAGIIAARLGLWMADLAITQMFMETVTEQERGVVNGVQNSLNQTMDMIKFGLVVGLPLAPQFGLLVILSFAFVFGGWVMYLVFICRLPPGLFSRGKLGAKSGGYSKI
ncbi:solute carrier family 40 member 1 [Aplysia californica]|uniref:Solute carrier family 40 member 1 n=1 Tax=Aplysia californica TaxID=6500 RepID=A0ABM1VQF3_APLCA|nr:solute carrier family 40 member 1 [Aplysia californica]